MSRSCIILLIIVPTLIVASCLLYLRLDCPLNLLSHRTTCGITADLNHLYTAHRWAVATSMSSYIFIVASMPLPHSYGIMLLWKQYETIAGLSCGITADFDCGIMPTLLRLDYPLDSSSHRTNCGITAGLSDIYSDIDATPTLLWDYAAMKAVWDHTRSFLQHHCQLWLWHHADFTCGLIAGSIRRLIGWLAASLRAYIIFILLINEQLRLPCRLTYL
jgi:hypothetical protein